MTVKIKPNDKGNPVGKLADAELHFTGGPFEDLKLVGFGIWERRGGSGRTVTFPAPQLHDVNDDLPVVLPRFRMLPDCLKEFVPAERVLCLATAPAPRTIVSSFSPCSAWPSYAEPSTGS